MLCARRVCMWHGRWRGESGSVKRDGRRGRRVAGAECVRAAVTELLEIRRRAVHSGASRPCQPRLLVKSDERQTQLLARGVILRQGAANGVIH